MECQTHLSGVLDTLSRVLDTVWGVGHSLGCWTLSGVLDTLSGVLDTPKEPRSRAPCPHLRMFWDEGAGSKQDASPA